MEEKKGGGERSWGRLTETGCSRDESAKYHFQKTPLIGNLEKTWTQLQINFKCVPTQTLKGIDKESE